MREKANTEQTSFDLIVIGAGPGGYVAAIRAAQLGLKVACVEKEKTLGGTCLNVGCIPSKALLESSELYAQAKESFKEHGINFEAVSLDLKKFMARKDDVVKRLTGGVAGLFKKNKITHLSGTAKVHKDKTVEITGAEGKKSYSAQNILIATGSVPVALPGIPFDGKRIIDSTAALSLTEVPGELLVIGGGYIGLELGSVYLRLGSRVTVVEMLDRIAVGMDGETGEALLRALKKQGMNFRLSAQVAGASIKGNRVDVGIKTAEGKEETVSTDYLLVAVGRKPCTEGLGLQETGVKLDEKGRIAVDKNFQTNVPGIYAVGDVIPGPMLAHKAMEEGVAAAEIISGEKASVNYNTIPSVVYTWPEVASVGLTEEECKKQGIAHKAFKYPFLANGRALSMGYKEGFVKLIADSTTDRLLGAHIIGPRASDMIAELVLGMAFEATAQDIAMTVHAHPTLSEAVKEAALGLGEGAIHL
ncbi:MAG: dihydrolipoyl dehydrogenase [Deltaproteobacteria bacterium]|nr:dihydrolipoyl dehydrogenase [Deltaproteobacteria bacterium]